MILQIFIDTNKNQMAKYLREKNHVWGDDLYL